MVYFLISAALFLPLIGGMIYFMRDVTDSQQDEDVGLEARARSLLDRLTGSPGVMTDGSTLWQDRDDAQGPTALVEAGIRHDTERLRISHAKLANLQRGGLAHDEDSPFVDYPELKKALGLDERFDFHLRMSPTGFERNVDPFGSKPLGAAHVAYVAALDGDGFSGGEWTQMTDQAKREVDAMNALNLGPYASGQAGFTTDGYYPATCPGGTTHNGTVVGDTEVPIDGRGILGSCIGSETKPYTHWFLEDYFWDVEQGDYRFDALVFGTGADLARWADAADAIGNAGIFLDFVEKGGVIVFLGSENLPADFVTDCASDHCLLAPTGKQVPMSFPDDTNQMLLAPNPLPALDTEDGPWRLETLNGLGENETHGFIPVFVEGAGWDPATGPADALLVHLGATTVDRYGDDETGGAVILSNWNLTESADVAEADISRVFSNLLSYGLLRAAYLDYGPEMPDDRVVRAAAKSGVLELPNGVFIEIRLQLYLWRA